MVWQGYCATTPLLPSQCDWRRTPSAFFPSFLPSFLRPVASLSRRERGGCSLRGGQTCEGAHLTDLTAPPPPSRGAGAILAHTFFFPLSAWLNASALILFTQRLNRADYGKNRRRRKRRRKGRRRGSSSSSSSSKKHLWRIYSILTLLLEVCQFLLMRSSRRQCIGNIWKSHWAKVGRGLGGRKRPLSNSLFFSFSPPQKKKKKPLPRSKKKMKVKERRGRKKKDPRGRHSTPFILPLDPGISLALLLPSSLSLSLSLSLPPSCPPSLPPVLPLLRIKRGQRGAAEATQRFRIHRGGEEADSGSHITVMVMHTDQDVVTARVLGVFIGWKSNNNNNNLNNNNVLTCLHYFGDWTVCSPSFFFLLCLSVLIPLGYNKHIKQ